jgi:hypothetical protein
MISPTAEQQQGKGESKASNRTQLTV